MPAPLRSRWIRVLRRLFCFGAAIIVAYYVWMMAAYPRGMFAAFWHEHGYLEDWIYDESIDIRNWDDNFFRHAATRVCCATDTEWE